MKSKLMIVLLLPFVLSGCMMAGMAAMGGAGHMPGSRVLGGHPDAVREPTVIKEVRVGGLRVTAEFPSFAAGDSLRFVAAVFDADGRAVLEDAAVSLEVSPVMRGGASETLAHGAHSPGIAHVPSNVAERTRVMPVERASGRYVLRPTVQTDGIYRLAIVVERVGATVFDPPIVLEHTAHLAPASESAHNRGQSMSSGLMPLAWLGAGVMAVMMLVAFR